MISRSTYRAQLVLTMLSLLNGGGAVAGLAAKTYSVQTFTGEIMDSICAGYKGHSYMMQQMKSMGAEKETCLKSCITQLGAKYVLFNRAQQNIYRIDNPDKVQRLAGRNVRISGVLIKNKKIRVHDIQPTD